MSRLVTPHTILPLTIGVCPLATLHKSYGTAVIRTLGIIYSPDTKLTYIGFAYNGYIGTQCKCFNQLAVVILQPSGKALSGTHYYVHPTKLPDVSCSRCPYDSASGLPRDVEPIVDLGTETVLSEALLEELVLRYSVPLNKNRYELLDLD